MSQNPDSRWQSMVGQSSGYIHPNQGEQNYPQTTPWSHTPYPMIQTTVPHGTNPGQKPLQATGI